ncbi:MAG: penicillin-binding protein 2 [Ornithinimicrobium sp.]
MADGAPVGVRERPRSAGQRNRSIGPIWALIVVVLALGGVLFGRLVQWQILRSDDFVQASAEANTREVLNPALRGRILAADGEPLAANDPSTVITVDPAVLADADDEGLALIEQVADELDLPPAVLWGRTRVCGSEGAPQVPLCFSGSPYQPIPIASDVDPVDALSLVERPEDFPGVAVESRPVRAYPAKGVNAAHVLGYLGRPSAEEVEAAAQAAADGGAGADGAAQRLLAPIDVVGRTGLEVVYDEQLRGLPERTVASVDPRGIVTGRVSHRDAVPGLDVRTHLDPAVQARAEEVLRDSVRQARRDGLPADAAAAVVLKVDTGAVVAAASWPTYDPNVWTGGISQTDYDALTDPEGGEPLVDRAVAETYPPASTFKAFSLPAALQTGIDPDAEYDCPGSVSIAGQRFTNYESKAQGEIDLQRIVEVSCDTVFYRWAFDNWKDLGGLRADQDLRDPYVLLAQDFGFGSRTGIDLPAEVRGSVPGRETKRTTWEATKDQICARAEEGYPDVADAERRRFLEQSAQENCLDGWQYRAGDAVNFAIGQGDMAVTPVQLASAYAAIANGGTLWTPQVAAGTQRADGTVVDTFEPLSRGEVFLEPKTLKIVRNGLAGVNTDGTGAAAFAGFDLDAYPVAGKTGSAEKLGARSTAWYASYGPTTDPEYAVVVVLEEGGIGGEVAAPAARKIWDLLASQ